MEYTVTVPIIFGTGYDYFSFDIKAIEAHLMGQTAIEDGVKLIFEAEGPEAYVRVTRQAERGEPMVTTYNARPAEAA